jgi:hypothetical protein
LWSRAHRPVAKQDDSHKAQKAASQAKVRQQLVGDESTIGTPFGLGTCRTAAAFANHLGVDFNTTTFVREGWECGDLSEDNFVTMGNGDDVFPEDGVEAKVAALDSNTKAQIAMFLQGINGNNLARSGVI